MDKYVIEGYLLLLGAGCFLVAVPDTCYDSSKEELSYCWCSHTDLCNSAPALLAGPALLLLIYSLGNMMLSLF